MMSRHKGIAGVFAGLAANSIAASLLWAGVAHSPAKIGLNIWEPIGIFLPDTGNAIRDRITKTAGQDQGYEVFKRFQDKDLDDDWAECTREKWDSFPSGGGVVLVDTHGKKRWIAAICVTSRSTAQKWIDAGKDNRGMTIYNAEKTGQYYVYVSPSWFRRNWRATLNGNMSIVYWAACDSVTVMGGAEGRTWFGYKEIVASSNARDDVNLLFGRMNGTIQNGALRKAGDAYKAGGFKAFLRMDGSKDTTLCPSVENPARKNVKPHGPRAGRKGTGYVIFDTHLDNTVDAKKILKWEVLKEQVEIYDIKWARQSDNRINFKYISDECVVDYKVKMIVDAKEAKAKYGKQELDGGTVEAEGIAPNSDNFVWTFED